MLDRHHHLGGVQAQGPGQVLQGVDGRPVDRGVTGLAQSAVVGANPEALQQGFQGRRAAVHARCLHHLVREKNARRSRVLSDSP